MGIFRLLNRYPRGSLGLLKNTGSGNSKNSDLKCAIFSAGFLTGVSAMGFFKCVVTREPVGKSKDFQKNFEEIIETANQLRP
jgi:hypothetical protein